MEFRIETITPETAKEYLKHNKQNRPLKPRVVETYAKDMRNGKWQLNPEGIGFYENGDLFDGQHRLTAIMKADTAVQMVVIRGVPDGTTMCDRGVNRTSADILHMNGIKSGVATNAGMGLVNLMFKLAGTGIHTITDSQRIDFVKRNEEALIETMRICGAGKHIPMTRTAATMVAVFAALQNGVSPETLERFCYIVNTGFSNGPLESAAIVYRNMLLSYKGNNSHIIKTHLTFSGMAAIDDFANNRPRTRAYRESRSCPYWETVKENIVIPCILQ